MRTGSQRKSGKEKQIAKEEALLFSHGSLRLGEALTTSSPGL